MKVLHLIVVFCFVHQIRAQGLSSECISTDQLFLASGMACQQTNNTALWQAIIDCHFEIDEKYLRNSSEALCPRNKFVEDPTNESHSIADVFRNICGLDEGSEQEKSDGINCLINGSVNPYIMDHITEVNDVKRRFGEKVPCRLGECIKRVFDFK